MYSAEYVVNEKRELKIVVYEKGGKQEIKPQQPYFYVRTSDLSKAQHTVQRLNASKGQGTGGWLPVIAKYDPSPYKTLNDEPVTKVSVGYPPQVALVRTALPDNTDTFEADVLFIRRWMLDQGLRCDAEYDLVGWFDIEAYDLHGFPNSKKDPMISIGLMTSDGEKKWFVVDDTTPAAKLTREQIYPKEKAMLDQFWYHVKQKKIQMLCAWNGENFDFPYLFDRMKFHNAKDKLLQWSRMSRKPNEVRWLDLLPVHRYVTARSTRNDLDSVAREVLHAGKKGKRGMKVSELPPTELEEYNMWDVHLEKGIDEAENLHLTMVRLAQETRLFPDECLAVRQGGQMPTPSPLIDTLVLEESKKYGYVLPTKKARTHEKYQGAVVLESRPGLYKNVLQLDFSCHVGSTEVLTKVGPTKISSVAANDEVYTPYGWQKVTAVHRYKISSPITKIVTCGGRTIKSTAGHRFPVIIANDMGEKAAGEMRRGNRLVVLADEPPIYNHDDVSKLFGAFLAEGGYLRKDQPYFDSARKKNMISHQHRLTFSISKDEKDFKSFIKKTLNTMYPGVHVYEKPKAGGNGLDLSINRKAVVTDFMGRYRKFLAGPVTLEDRAAFLSGFFEGDGSINTARNTIGFNQSKVNEEKLRVVLSFLRALGIPFTCNKYGHKSGTYYCELSGLFSTTKFYTSIGFISNSKSDELRNAMHQRILKAKNGGGPRFGLYMHTVRNGSNSRHPFIGIDKIKTVETVGFSGCVYDITLEWPEFPYYYANGILSHNSLYPNSVICWSLSPDKEKKMMPELLKRFLVYKKEADASGDKLSRTAMKLILNASYGLFGSPYFRIYRVEIASEIAARARDFFLSAVRIFQEDLGLEIIVGDTDSCFINLGGYIGSPSESRAASENILKIFREKFDALWREKVKDPDYIPKMDVNGFWSKMLVPVKSGGTIVKKRYVGTIAFDKNWVPIDPKDPKSFEVKGLELVRSDISDLAKEVQQVLIFMKLDERPTEELTAHLTGVKRELYSGKLDEKLILRKGLSKEFDLESVRAQGVKAIYNTKGDPEKTYHVETPIIKALMRLEEETGREVAAREGEEAGKEAGREALTTIVANRYVEYVICKSNRPIVVTGDIPKEIDYEYYWKRQIEPIATRLSVPLPEADSSLDIFSS